ncbi:conserved hypothetical protein [Shewanella halifaxensis HAW-EB4]|uniref:DUF2971 domain-containing protein n=1 Tax=Shewanella halifaxensis (strain HAW-EB4) TaxID=458817 RepID=B0TP45_SHEHH|nr:DUF2971 domain-containing protein [Shewanella halifaxensis]ABZ76202.1 conserved hypothetical protein [Shewanella halifaxensis HAW-EB4]
MLFKYVSNRWIDSLICKNEIRFTQFTALNDPFESSVLMQLDEPATDDEYEKMLPSVANIRRYLEKPSTQGRMTAEYFSSIYGILSLSRNVHNMLMWAHYGESHTGFAIGFDEQHEFFKESGDNDFEPALKKVVYSKNRVVQTHDEELIFCHKSIDWAYEEEERLFKLLDLGGANGKHCQFNEPVYLFKIPKEAYKSIYIGANMPKGEAKKLILACETHLPHVDVYTAEVSDEKYELVFNPQT